MKRFLCKAGFFLSLVVCTSCASKTAGSLTADDAITSISVIGTIGMDGSKPKAIAVEYCVDLSGAKVDLSTFDVFDYGQTLGENDLNAGKDAGKPTKIYINDVAEVSESGGTGKGNFVIIEVNTDYSVSRYARSYKATMAAGVVQKKPIKSAGGIISPSSVEKGNYYDFEYIGIDPQTGGKRPSEFYRYANDGTYTIAEIAGYTKEVFAAKHCFDEGNGEYWDFDLPYALYVPSDYDESKNTRSFCICTTQVQWTATRC